MAVCDDLSKNQALRGNIFTGVKKGKESLIVDGRRRCRDDTCIVLVHNRTAVEFDQTKGIVRIKNTDVITCNLVGYEPKTIHVSSLHFSDTNEKIKQQKASFGSKHLCDSLKFVSFWNTGQSRYDSRDTVPGLTPTRLVMKCLDGWINRINSVNIHTFG